MDKYYISIDLKSFFASVECMERSLDPLTTNLVVADSSRTDKTICLAVSPSLKSYGIPGRPRLFEVKKRIKEINAGRYTTALRKGCLKKDENGKPQFTSSSYSSIDLEADPSLELSYIIAPPHMRYYEEYSTKIVSIYLKYVAPEDLHVYSIDEVFINATPYLNTYRMSAHDLAMTMIRDVLTTTGITATAGIGTNLYLAKIAMDIVAKKAKPDKDGVRIAELNERTYREKLWCHQPLTDFWRVGKGYAKRLNSMGLFTMGDIANLSINAEDVLYSAFGVNAELLIDHAWGWEPVTLDVIKSYVPETKSLTSGQVLMEPYDFDKGRLIVREMTELLALDLTKKGLFTKQMTLTIGYDRESLKTITDKTGRTVYKVTKTDQVYTGKVKKDQYGRIIPVHAHGTGNIDKYTNNTRRIMDAVLGIYDRVVDPDLLIRRVNVVVAGLIREKDIPPEEPVQLDMFTDYEALQKQEAAKRESDEKEKKMQEATLIIQEKFGKNTLIKGMNLKEGGTTIERNNQIGGHKA